MDTNSFSEVKSQVEAILFSYGDWISINEIMNALSLDSEILISNALEELKAKYQSVDFSFFVEYDGNLKWRMVLKPEFDNLITNLVSGTELDKKVVKVLSVIAYEQPVTKTRLSDILGKTVKNEVEWLYRNKFLSCEKKGIGKYYKVTKKFYDYFKLDEDEDFRQVANKSITTFLHENV